MNLNKYFDKFEIYCPINIFGIFGICAAKFFPSIFLLVMLDAGSTVARVVKLALEKFNCVK